MVSLITLRSWWAEDCNWCKQAWRHCLQLSLSTVLAVVLATVALIWTVWARQKPAIEFHDVAAIYADGGNLLTRIHLSHDGTCKKATFRQSVIRPDGTVFVIGTSHHFDIQAFEDQVFRRTLQLGEVADGDYEYQGLILCITATGDQRPYIITDVRFRVSSDPLRGFGPTSHPL